MILVDTSVWIDHLRSRDAALEALLNGGLVLTHPFVIGEMSLGNLRARSVIIGALENLPAAVVATEAEVRAFIERDALFGQGVGYVGAHLLAAVRLTPDAALWTRDGSLATIALRLQLAAKPVK